MFNKTANNSNFSLLKFYLDLQSKILYNNYLNDRGRQMTPKQLLLIWELNFSLLKFYLLNIDDPLLELARKCNGLMLGTDNSQE